MRGTTGMLLVVLALTGAAPGCSGGLGGHVICTDMGCSSGVGAEITAEAMSGVTGPFVARLCAHEQCTQSEHRAEDAARPIHVWQELGVARAGDLVPVRAELEQDGVVLLEHEREVRLRESRPNGPRCGPVCHQRLLVVDGP